MRALVLGGSRFIGRRLVAELLAAGHQVTLFNRGRTADPFGSAVQRVTGDRRSAADLATAAGGRELDAAYDFLSYEAADARLACAALDGRVGHFIHISTCSVYWCTGDFPCPVPEEDFDRLGDFPRRPSSIEYEYGYNKRKAEEALFEAHQARGFPVTTVRMPIVAGEEDPSLRLASYVQRLLDGGPLILPDGGHPSFRQVYVADVAGALAAIPASRHAIGQAYNLAGTEILSVRTIVAALAQILGCRADVVEIPTPVLRALGLGTAFSPFSQQAAQIPSVFKARRDLGWNPTPLEVWLERAARWAAGRPEGSEPPPACAFRRQEIEVAQYYRSLAAEKLRSAPASGRDGTSGEPPG